MNNYIENPKTKGSGILCAIPQTGTCPNGCKDCFFQSGRSYLEPLKDHLPNLPDINDVSFQIIRVNDGNDSNVDYKTVVEATSGYRHKFFNTAIPKLNHFKSPVVLTVNPGKMTDHSFYTVQDIPKNLMFVRFRSNTWNTKLRDECVKFYSEREVPVVLTFMAYFNDTSDMPLSHAKNYIFRKRTSNDYHAITTDAWREVMGAYKDNKWVYSCGKIEGEDGDTHCARCGNCIREYFVTKSRMEM